MFDRWKPSQNVSCSIISSELESALNLTPKPARKKKTKSPAVKKRRNKKRRDKRKQLKSQLSVVESTSCGSKSSPKSVETLAEAIEPVSTAQKSSVKKKFRRTEAQRKKRNSRKLRNRSRVSKVRKIRDLIRKKRFETNFLKQLRFWSTDADGNRIFKSERVTQVSLYKNLDGLAAEQVYLEELKQRLYRRRRKKRWTNGLPKLALNIFEHPRSDWEKILRNPMKIKQRTPSNLDLELFNRQQEQKVNSSESNSFDLNKFLEPVDDEMKMGGIEIAENYEDLG